MKSLSQVAIEVHSEKYCPSFDLSNSEGLTMNSTVVHMDNMTSLIYMYTVGVTNDISGNIKSRSLGEWNPETTTLRSGG